MYRYHRPRRWRGGFFFPFPLLIFLFFMNWGHMSSGFITLLTVLLPIIIVLAFGAFIRNRTWGYYQQPYQNSQPPYYNQQNTYTNQYYQPPASPYTPYQQGYQQAQRPAEQPHETYQERESQETNRQQYQEYEQPQAQYPEQMPPMQ